MKVKKLIWMFVLILSIQIVTALPNATYELNNDVTDGKGGNDGTNSGVSFVAFVPSYNVSGDGLPTSGYYQPAGTDEFSINEVVTGTNQFTVSMWVYYNASACPDRIFGQGSGNSDRSIDIGRQGGDCKMTASYATSAGGSFEQTITSSVAPSLNSWQMWTFVRNTTQLRQYVNTTLDGSATGGTSTNTRSPTGNTAYVGEGMNTGLNLDNGYIDHVRIYREALGPDEITNLWNCGDEAVSDCSSGDLNESLEKTFQDSQLNSISFAGGAPVTITSENFNISDNNTGTYFGTTLGLLSTVNNELTCQLLIDGTDFDSTVVRSNNAGDSGSIYLTTTNITLDEGNHSSELVCQRTSGGGTITISDTVIVGHILTDEQNETINSTYNNFSKTLSSSETELSSFNYTTNNISTDSDIQRFLVIDWEAIYGYTSAGNIDTNIRFDGFINCSNYPRVGSINDIGSVGGSCIARNVPSLSQVNISFHGNGTGNVTFKSHVKEFIIQSREINTTNLKGLNITSSSLTQIATMNIQNVDHGTSNIFFKTGIPITSNNGTTTARVQIQMTGGKTDETRVYNRTVDNSGAGVIIINEVFEDINTGTYDLNVFASCDNSNCTVIGDGISGYLTTIEPFTTNSLNITMFDNFTLAPIQNFNVTINDNVTIEVTNFVAEIITTEINVDLLITSDKYHNRTFLNYNTGSDLNESMIPFTNIFVVDTDGQTILNFDVNYTNGSISGTASSNASGVAQIGIFNDTFLVTAFNINNATTNYAQRSANLTANPGLENHTFEAFFTNSFNLVFLDEQTRELINTTNITVQFLSSVEALNFSTSNGTIFVDALTPAEVEIRYDADGYDLRSYFIFLQNQTFNNISLYLLNESVSTQVIVKGLDENGIPVEGVIFQVKREYIIDSQVVFQIVEMDNSDFGGEAVFNLQLNDPNYKWLVVRNVTDNEVLFTSNAAEITSTTLTFFLNVLADPLASFRVVTNLITGQELIATTPSYDNGTKLWSATFEIPDASVVEEVCLTVDQITNFGFLQVNQSCTTANTGTLTVGYDNDLLGSLAKLELSTNTKFSDYLLTSNTFSPSSGTLFGNAGVFIGVWIISTLALAFIANAAMMVVATFIALTSIAVLGVIGMTYLSYITLAITAGILLFSMRK